jgi:hypothetical protein
MMRIYVASPFFTPEQVDRITFDVGHDGIRIPKGSGKDFMAEAFKVDVFVTMEL